MPAVTSLIHNLLPFPLAARCGQYILGTVYFTRVNLLYETSCLESVLYVDDPWLAFTDKYADNVEAHRVEVRRSHGEVPFGKCAYSGLLAGGDGLERVPEGHSSAKFHFNEDKCILVAQDQIQLPVAGSVVTFDECVPPPRQVVQRELLAPRAGASVAQGATPA